MEEFTDISDEVLLRIWNTKEDFVIVLENDIYIPTSNIGVIDYYENWTGLLYIIYTSDFELMFGIKDELIRRGILI